MVEENFKVGIELEVEQDSLAAITKQVEKAVKKAFDNATAGAARGGGPAGAAKPPVGGGAATSRSIAQAANVTQADFAKAVREVTRENRVVADKFDSASAAVVQSLEKLTKALERRAAGAPVPQSPTQVIVEKQTGPTNKNLARDIKKNRQEAGRQTTGSGGTSEKRTDLRTGTRKDQPNAMQDARQRKAAREAGAPPHRQQQFAEARAKEVSNSLDRLAKEIQGLGKLGEIPDILKRVGLPTGADVRVGSGATAEIKTLTGQAKTVTGYIRMVGTEVKESTNIVSKRINDLLGSADFKKTLQRAEQVAAKPGGQERALAMIRRELKGVLRLPSSKQGGAQGYSKGGETKIDIEFDKVMRERYAALKDDSSLLAALNKDLWEMSEVLKKLGKTAGVEVLGSVGLSEETAADVAIKRGEKRAPLAASINAQVRDIAGMNIGGRGGMRWARSFQPAQARQLINGQDPRVMGRGEAEAYGSGVFKPGMVRNMRTAMIDPRKTPEVSEDMILIDKKAAEKMAMWEPKITQPLKELATDLKAGQQLIHGQVIGTDIEGEEITFDLKGAQAEIESIEEVVENGIRGHRIRLKEMYELKTGSKITTSGGFKGVVKVVENMAEKYGLAQGTEVAMTGHGAAKRGILGDVMKMMATEIADKAQVEAQEVANVIEDAMRNGGKDLVQAVEGAAEAFGVKGFTGGQAGSKIQGLTGELPWMRLKEPREQGPAAMGKMYYDLPAMRSLQQRAGTDKMANDMQARMRTVTAEQTELIATLQALAGNADVAAENLREMLPEEFKRLPAGVGAIEDFAGTILDPQFQKALAIRMPTREGGDRLMRMPAIGKNLGTRGGFETPLGAKGSEEITRRFDDIIQQARQIRVAEGRATPNLSELTESDETYRDAAHKTSRAIKNQVEELREMGLRTEEGAAAADEFVNSMLPLIDTLKLTEDISFYKLKGGERTTQKPVTVARAGSSAKDFVSGGKTAEQRLYRLQDVLAGRTGRKSGTTENLRTSGEVFKSAEVLQSVMEELGVTMEQSAGAVDKMHARLEKLESGLVKMLSVSQVMGTNQGGDPRRIPLAAQMGAGLGPTSHKELTAIQFRTDVDEELREVARILTDMGGSAGALTPELMEALDAMDRIRGMQGDVAKIPRDAVLINKEDWDSLVESTAKEQGVDKGEAERRLQRTGLLQRYPVTGGASFLATKAGVDTTGEVGAGKIGVAGPMAVSSLEDLAAMKAPLEALEQELYSTIQANQGQGEAAEHARQKLEQIVPVLGKLNQQYLAIGLNLDFDGDKIRWLADTATEAGAGIQTFSEKVGKGGVSFQQMMMNIMGGVGGGASGNVQEYADLFGKTAKLRAKGGRAVLNPETGEMAQAEAQAHTGGKMSVGLLTDAYNKMMLSVTEGTKKTGDAWATGLDYLMLNINKSLAQKGGGGGVAGPMEFLEDLKAGNLEKIFSGMKTGGAGVYGEMGDYNKAMREQMSAAFKSTYHRKGSGGLRDIAKAEGIEDIMPQGDITYENFVGVVEKMVDALDLEAVIRRMFDQMRDNMKRALQNEGMKGAELQQTMDSYFEVGKGGDKPGMDVDRMLKNLSPDTQAYMLTRKKQVKEAKQELTPMEAAQRAMQLLPRKIATELSTLEDEFSIEDKVDPQARAAEIAADLNAFYVSVRESFKTFARPEDLRKILPSGGKGYTEEQLGKIRGVHVPRTTPGGEKMPGEVYLSEAKTEDPFIKAIATIERMAAGADITAEELQTAAKRIKEFGQTLSHEYVHKANKQRGSRQPVASMARSLGAQGTALGQNRDKILEVMGQKSNIGKLIAARKSAVRSAQEQGIAEGDDPAVRSATKKLLRQVAEELMAYQTDPEFLSSLRQAGVGEEALEEMKKGFDKLREKEPELIEAAMDVTRRASNAIVTGLMDGLKGAGSAAGEGGISDALKGAFPGSDVVHGTRGKLAAQEEVVMGGAQMLGLSRMKRKGGMISIEEPLAKTGFEEDFKITTSKIADVINTMRQGLPDPDVLLSAEKEIRQEARSLESGIEQSPGGKGKGRQVYMKTLQEFHAAVSVGFINKARALEKAIAEARASGAAERDPTAFRDLIAELYQTVEGHEEYLKRTLTTGGRGRGTVVSNISTPGGDLAPGAREAGIIPGPQMLQQQIKSIAGEGAEASAFLKQMGPAIESAVGMLGEGEDHLKIWGMLFEALLEDPKMLHTNLAKITDILGKVSRHIGFADGKFSDAATSALELADNTRKIGNAIKGKDIKTIEDFHQVMAGAPKAARLAAKPGGGMAQSIAAQYEEAERIMKDYQKRLQKLIETPGYKKAGAPKQFEAISYDIVDPETGKVFQKISIEARRAGKNVKVSMKQAGAATTAFGNQMRNAFRRVVQWGFASGIVYGVVRALRSMSQIIVEVQTKMVSLQKVMNTATTNFEKMQDSATGMAREFGVSIEDVLDGMVVYGQQGLEINEIMERTRATMLAVNVTTLSSVEATEALTAAHKVFGGAVDGSTGFVDAWAAVAAKHAITAKDLADAVKRSGAAAKTAGVGFHEFLGVVTAIGAVTRQTGKELATSTKFMFRAMRRPTAQKQLLKVGISTQDTTGEMLPAMDILTDVAAKWDDMGRAQQLAMAQAMAGIRHYNQFIVLMENFTEAQDAAIDSQHSQGFAAQKNQLVMKSLAKQMQVLRETMKSLALSFGKAILPMATLAVSGISKLVDAFNLLPDILKQITVLGGGAAVALTRVADFAVDTMDVLMGDRVGQAVKEGGIFSAIGGLGKKAVGSFRGMGLANTLASGAGVASGAKTMKDAMDMARLDESERDVGMLANAFFNLKTSLIAAGQGFMKMGKMAKIATAGTVIGLVLALGGLAAAYFSVNESGKEVEDGMFDQIGKAKAAADAYARQASEIKKLQTIQTKLGQAMAVEADPEKFKDALASGKYKSSAKMAKEYGDAVSKTAVAMAGLDPSIIRGITDEGEYLIDVASGFEQIAFSAEDAQKATVAALQTKVIKAYAAELTEATSTWDKVLEFFGKDVGFDAQIKEARDAVQELAQARDESINAGVYAPELQDQMNQAVEKELEIREKMIGVASQLKRVMSEMPTFSDMSLAQATMGPAMMKSIEASVGTGVFGRQATVGSVAMGQMAKSAGLGGQIGYETAATPGAALGSALEQGLTLRGGVAQKAGAMSIVSAEAAKKLLELTNGIESLGDSVDPGKMDETVDAARTMFSYVDSRTGELMYQFWDSVGGNLATATADKMQEIIEQTGASIATVDRAAIEEAAAKTRRLLTISITGAMAGIREPGQVQIGPALGREVTAEQRMLGSLPEDMQRLMEIQNELSTISKEYNEQITEGDLTGAASGLSQSAKNLKVLKKATIELVQAIQREGFDLTVLAHYNKALHEVNMTMESTATAMRDAAIEERARQQIVKHTSGALMGQPVAASLSLGKSARELTGVERLQQRMGPGVAQALGNLAGLQKDLELLASQRADLEKSEANFNEMLQSFAQARTRLEKEQALSRGKAKEEGQTAGDIAIREQLASDAQKQQALLGSQLSVQERMADALGVLADLELAPDEAARADVIRKAVASATGDQLSAALGVGGNQLLQTATAKLTGVRAVPEEEQSAFTRAFGVRNFESQVPYTAQDFMGQAARETGLPEEDLRVKQKAEALFEQYQGLVEVIRSANQLLATESGQEGSFGFSTVSPTGMLSGLAKEKRAEATQGILGFDVAREDLAPLIAGAATNTALQDIEDRKAQAVANEVSMEQKHLQAKQAYFENLQAAYAQNEKQAAETLAKAKMAEQVRIAQNAEQFAITLENIVNDFKKAQALAYEKIDSDLEGPFARVGQPGFKTTFEQRREALEAGSGRPMSMEQMRQRDKDRKQIDFDEKEAKIKQEQDIQTKALRDQQGQAEKMRQAMADALFSGQLEGTGLEGDAKKWMETLTGELATSEQATERNGELFFKGVPSLEQAAKAMQEVAKKRAEAEMQKVVEAQKKGNEPVVQTLQTGFQQVVAAVNANGPGPGGVAGMAALPPGSVKGIPAIAGAAPAVPGAAPTVPGMREAAQAIGMGPQLAGLTDNQLSTMASQVMGTGAPAPVKFAGMAEARQYDDSSGYRKIERYNAGKIGEPLDIKERMVMDWDAYKKDHFVEEQYIRGGKKQPTPEELGPVAPDRDTLRRIDAMAGPATQTFAPGQRMGMGIDQLVGMDIAGQKAGRGPIDLNASMRMLQMSKPGGSLPTVGRTASNLEAERQARAKTGDATATDSTVIDTDSGPTSGSRQEIQRREREGQGAPDSAAAAAEGTEGLQSSLEALSGKIDQIISAVGGIGDVGTKIDAATAAVEDLKDGVNVTVTDPIEISNTSEIGDAINAGLGDLGSAVTDGVTRLAALETIVGDEDIDTRIGSAVTDATTQLTTDITTQLTEGQEAAVTAAQVAAQEAATNELVSLTTQITELQTLQEELSQTSENQTGLLDSVNTAIEQTQSELSAAISRVEDAETAVTAAGSNITAIQEDVEEAKTAADEAKTTAATAQTTAEAASETATDAANSVLTLRTSLDSEKTAREAADRDLDSAITRVDATDQAQDTAIKKLQKDTGIALANAKLALNKAGQR